ncbi:hypothetical protein [Demequina globuliformis]|uniref:hypothetical protein n=1 Tax=Demequina globuliformis TaxID=676202 RepID=UPI000780AA1F|nr:hypothetical protein [Demequina globuliformis]
MTDQSTPPRTPALEHVRRTAMGPLAVGLGVAVVVGLLLSVVVPPKTGVFALIVLGSLVAAAVGFTVRYVTVDRGWRTQATAFVSAAVGVHLMAVTGTLTGSALPLARFTGVERVAFDDALMSALATPPFSVGTLLGGLVAAMIAGWAPRR